MANNNIAFATRRAIRRAHRQFGANNVRVSSAFLRRLAAHTGLTQLCEPKKITDGIRGPAHISRHAHRSVKRLLDRPDKTLEQNGFWALPRRAQQNSERVRIAPRQSRRNKQSCFGELECSLVHVAFNI